MTIDDLYEYDDTEYGKGRYAVIRPARRRRKSRYMAQHDQDNINSRNEEPQHNEDQLRGVGLLRDQHHHHHPSSSKPKLENYDCALKIIDKVMFYDRVKHGRERLDGS